jgi:hypothetical protein
MSAPAGAPPRRRLRRVLLAGAGLAGLIVALLLWGLFWPAPHAALRCGPDDGARCRAVAGRVVYAPKKDRADPTRPLHLVLLSRDSTALPLVSVVKIPPAQRPRRAPGVGRWVSVVGIPHEGSNGETDLGVSRTLMP